jgi:nitrate reductase gamma subunit
MKSDQSSQMLCFVTLALTTLLELKEMGDTEMIYRRIERQKKHRKSWQSDIIFQFLHYFMVASGLRGSVELPLPRRTVPMKGGER